MDELISIKNLHKQYLVDGQVITNALTGINLTVKSGEFVAIMGHSGSGKSTFMNILGCLDVQTSGQYFLKGKDVGSMNETDLAHIRNTTLGFVFQNFNLLQRRSLATNVALPLLYAGMKKDVRIAKAVEMLNSVGSESRVNVFPNQLSGGQQQRVAIARAIANNPEIILADEPTGNLDTATSIEIMKIFTNLNQNSGITIIIVTHESDIARYAKRLVQFKDGIIIYDGPVM